MTLPDTSRAVAGVSPATIRTLRTPGESVSLWDNSDGSGQFGGLEAISGKSYVCAGMGEFRENAPNCPNCPEPSDGADTSAHPQQTSARRLAQALLAELARRGVVITLALDDPTGLRARGPRGALTTADRAALVELKPVLLELLTTYPCTACAGPTRFPRPTTCFWCRAEGLDASTHDHSEAA